MQDEQTVIARRDGRVGRIVLNRPKTLNALDLPMIRACAQALETWRDDPHVHAVVIEGAGDRAFCAGGDVRALRQYELDGEHHKAETFFREEYQLNLMIATYPKPYIALIDGICMGGGIGVSVHAPYRVATERAAFAMPETAIGFFPDIGATYFLPRLPGQLGTYLGLTGAAHAGRRCGACGTGHAFRAARGPARAVACAGRGWTGGAGHACRAAAGVLAGSAARGDRSLLRRGQHGRERAPARGDRRCVGDADPGGAADGVAFRAVLDAGGVAPRGDLTLPQCQAAELALTRTTMRHPDFAEGVRAMVVDKDRKPRWQPSRIEDVDPAVIAAMFG